MIEPAHVVIERIRHLPIPADVLPVLMEVAKHVLTHPVQFFTAAKALNDEIANVPAHVRASYLHRFLLDIARSVPPALSGDEYSAWAARLMLLVTLSVYPGDLSRLGTCGEIPWEGGIIEDAEGTIEDVTLGRSHMLFEHHGELREKMLDMSWQSVEERVTRVVNDRPVDREFITHTGQSPGLLGAIASRLEPVLAELRAHEPAASNSVREPESSPAVPGSASASAPVGAREPVKVRRGRLRKHESDAKRNQMLATIRQHPSLKDDPARLAYQVGVSESTVRRWLDAEEQRYRESIPARPAPPEE